MSVAKFPSGAQRKLRQRVLGLAAQFAMFALLPLAQAGLPESADCGELRNAIGPFDYYDAKAETVLRDVELNHFNLNVRTLRSGQTGDLPIWDLDYMLRMFPNHPAGLETVVRYQLSGGLIKRFRTADCYLERGIRFRPADPLVRSIAGSFLMKTNDLVAAREQFQKAVELAPQSSEMHYNLGLLEFKAGRYAEARKAAERAYALGYPLPGLRNKLIRVGAWTATTANSAK
jgi:tetratricopeptide (TPR) repeat protein